MELLLFVYVYDNGVTLVFISLVISNHNTYSQFLIPNL
jgi:hypothetical protein